MFVEVILFHFSHENILIISLAYAICHRWLLLALAGSCLLLLALAGSCWLLRNEADA